MSQPKNWKWHASFSALLLGTVTLVGASSTGDPVAFLGTDSGSTLSSFLIAVAEAESDAQLGSSGFAVELETRTRSNPGTLSEYCSGGPPAGTISEGAPVKAEWRGLGTFYPGEVSKMRSNGKVDIAYDDGFTERNVKPSRVKVEETQQKKAKPPKDDPACQLSDFVADVKIKIDKVNAAMSSYIVHSAFQKTADKEVADEEEEEELDTEENKSTSDSDKFVPANETQLSELEKLKRDLADADEEIEDLEFRVNENDELLTNELGQDHDDLEESLPASASAVDKLIFRYKKRLARRNRKIKKLKERLEEQKRQVDDARRAVPTLDDVSQDVDELSQDVDKAKAKRDKLEKEGKLDSELRVILDGIFKQTEKLQKKVKDILQFQEEARREEELERAAAKKKQSAKERRAARRRAEAAKAKVLAAAKEVETDLRGVSESTKKLETGVHPHGHKWWRYRYEHSFVEGIVMVLVTVLMMIWERIYKSSQIQVWTRSRSDADTTNNSTMLLDWFECMSGEMMVCLLVYLTVWILGHCYIFELLPMVLKQSEHIHLPSTGAEYKEVAWEICVVLFFAILFYFALTLSVIRACTAKLHHWASMENKMTDSAADDQSSGRDGREYEKMKSYFAAQVGFNAELCNEIKEKFGRPLNFKTFPFWVYLRMNVRSTVDPVYRFGFSVWMSVIVTFATLTVLHYYAHIGFLRVMMFFGLLQVTLLVAMASWIRHINLLSQKDNSEAEPVEAPCCGDFNIEAGVIFAVHYTLFFLCYGAARMICQPWMWELHFWPVLGLTIFTALFSVAFCVFVAPMLPCFAVAMAMPPYMDPVNIELMIQATGMNKLSAADYLRMGTSVSD
eukprot:TRINITY_DN13139_c0_g1_i1.p1 TRINITY_DN13139_c0_g1~~TRINITY_DN13139_c0_g1_i1.p1  ORF type:complete len:848 (-),score=164.11 TRINITY_DN13139_c0_g1_i1:204-2747(-)